MKRFFVFLSITFLYIALPGKSLAHTLDSSGTVGAVMHVTPDDDPIAGEQSDFFFEFKDTTNTFSPQNCDCRIIVSEAGKEILSQPLFSDNTTPSLTHASFSYTFPQKNIYAIQINGKPIRAGKFTTFTLTYDVRVDRERDTNIVDNSNNTFLFWIKLHAIHAVPALVAVLFIIWLVIQNKKPSRKGGE